MPSRSRAGHTKESTAALLEMIEVAQARLDGRHNAEQSALAFQERQARQGLAIDAQDIERIEVRPLAAKQQLVELRAAVGLQAADFAIEHCGVRADGVGDFPGELRHCVNA